MRQAKIYYKDDLAGILTETDDGAVKLGGQHQLLGWRLERPVLDFLHLMGAELDVDEYG